VIINDQLAAQGDKRCFGINNNDTLLPTIDAVCPCVKDVEGFSLSNLSPKQREEFLNCVVSALPGTGTTLEEKITSLSVDCAFPEPSQAGLCALITKSVGCNF